MMATFCIGQLLAIAGSLGCPVSGVVTAVIRPYIGSDSRIALFPQAGKPSSSPAAAPAGQQQARHS
jgi:hypothetical protein